MTDDQVRAINDEINRMYAQKARWDMRIIELGGPDFRRSGPRNLGTPMKQVPGSKYKYFGRALDLPGVAELFEEVERGEVKESITRDHVLSVADAKYYGYDDDSGLAAMEAELELENGVVSDQFIPTETELAHVVSSIPNLQQLEELIVARKRKILLEKYA